MNDQKQSRTQRTRQALFSAGFELMLGRSIEAIPIDELIAVAGVGKGSFFNHFGDKEGFKAAVALQVRSEIESQVGLANEREEDPLARLTGGMREVTRYACLNPKRAVAVLRMTVGATEKDYPLNEGLKTDINACVEAGLLRSEARESGVLFWLGLCTLLMTTVVENSLTERAAAEKLRDIMVMGLSGLGVDSARAEILAADSAERLTKDSELLS